MKRHNWIGALTVIFAPPVVVVALLLAGSALFWPPPSSAIYTCIALIVNVHDEAGQPVEHVSVRHDYRPYDFTITTPSGDCYVMIKDGEPATLRLHKQGYEGKEVEVASGTKEISVTLKAKEEAR